MERLVGNVHEAEKPGAGVGAGDYTELPDDPSQHDSIVVIYSESELYRSGFSLKKLLHHMGPGFLMCIAFVDPGNLEADLQTGAHTGYSLLWLLLWSTAMGMLLQSLATRLGVVTGRHLAQHCRAKYPLPVRITLWLMAELAIIGSDIQEVIGAAIALLLLSGGTLPLWAGVIIAAVGAYLLLLLEKFGSRWLEVLFQLLVASLAVTMGILFFDAQVPYAEVVRGLVVPHLDGRSVPLAAALLGSIVMPHNLFLHSALVHDRRLPQSCRHLGLRESLYYYNLEALIALCVTLGINVAVISVFAKGFHGHKQEADKIGLENAGKYLGKRFGRHMEIIWAIGLLAAGQSSTMTGTYAGQFVMSGYLNLKMNAATRALLTRAVALGPTLLVALTTRDNSRGLDVLSQWINVLQSVQLPFAIIPLLALTSDRALMGIGFVNSRATTIICWVVALGIMAVNGGVAYQTAAQRLPAIGGFSHVIFWGVVVVYVAFVVYLAITSVQYPPERILMKEGNDGEEVDEAEVVQGSLPPLEIPRPSSPPIEVPLDSSRSVLSSHAIDGKYGSTSA